LINTLKTKEKRTEINYSSLCVRCGKERVFSKRWKEKVKTFTGFVEVTHVEMLCPDGECQMLVDGIMAGKKEKREQMEKIKSDRMKRVKRTA